MIRLGADHLTVRKKQNITKQKTPPIQNTHQESLGRPDPHYR